MLESPELAYHWGRRLRISSLDRVSPPSFQGDAIVISADHKPRITGYRGRSTRLARFGTTRRTQMKIDSRRRFLAAVALAAFCVGAAQAQVLTIVTSFPKDLTDV